MQVNSLREISVLTTVLLPFITKHCGVSITSSKSECIRYDANAKAIKNANKPLARGTNELISITAVMSKKTNAVMSKIKENMSKPNDSAKKSAVIEIQSHTIELKPGDNGRNAAKFDDKNVDMNFTGFSVEKSPNVTNVQAESSTDETDQSCVNCTANDSGQNKENVSLSISSDDETEQAISLNMNKKSNSISYKGK